MSSKVTSKYFILSLWRHRRLALLGSRPFEVFLPNEAEQRLPRKIWVSLKGVFKEGIQNCSSIGGLRPIASFFKSIERFDQRLKLRVHSEKTAPLSVRPLRWRFHDRIAPRTLRVAEGALPDLSPAFYPGFLDAKPTCEASELSRSVAAIFPGAAISLPASGPHTYVRV